MQIDKLPVPIEMKIVALIARGDRYVDIRDTIKEEFGRSISGGVITYIKKRNPETLATIRDAIVQKELDDAQGLLVRSHRLIGKQLREAEKSEDPSIKTSDLVAISKEMFHQTRVEQGLPEDPAKLTNPKEKLKELQEMLEENDEIRLERIIFAKRDATTQTLNGPIPASGGDRGEHGSIPHDESLPPRTDANRQAAEDNTAA